MYDCSNRQNYSGGKCYASSKSKKEAGIEAEASEKGSVLDELKAKKDEVAKQPKKEAVEKAVKSKGSKGEELQNNCHDSYIVFVTEVNQASAGELSSVWRFSYGNF